VKMPVRKSGCEYRWANCDSPTGYMHFPVIPSNYSSITAYICRRFISTTAFLAGKYNCTVNYGRPME